jgi:hypothetical protein
MSSILYYSNYCNNSKSVIKHISSSNIKDDMHFVCIDNRRVDNNNNIYVQLQNGQDILMPSNVDKVPALLLLMQNHKVLFGDDIIKYLEPKEVIQNNVATSNNGEPLAFTLNSNSCFGVASDNYSFLDQNDTDLSAKGNGGLRQQHHYSILDNNTDNINTPPDTYTNDTIGEISIEQLQQQRNNDIN